MSFKLKTSLTFSNLYLPPQSRSFRNQVLLIALHSISGLGGGSLLCGPRPAPDVPASHLVSRQLKNSITPPPAQVQCQPRRESKGHQMKTRASPCGGAHGSSSTVVLWPETPPCSLCHLSLTAVLVGRCGLLDSCRSPWLTFLLPLFLLAGSAGQKSPESPDQKPLPGRQSHPTGLGRLCQSGRLGPRAAAALGSVQGGEVSVSLCHRCCLSTGAAPLLGLRDTPGPQGLGGSTRGPGFSAELDGVIQAASLWGRPFSLLLLSVWLFSSAQSSRTALL